jgi:GrpB-like predicted nucleotidyltransferase (UPF0157 family)
VVDDLGCYGGTGTLPSASRTHPATPDRDRAYDPAWPERFAELGRELRGGLGDVALRIDHIGSTSVPGLAAKPIIDLQVYVQHYNGHRPHRALGLQAPDSPARPTIPREDHGGTVHRRDLLGGLLHEYRRAA